VKINRTGSITTPRGYKAAGIYCGIKKKGKDLALLFSEMPGTAVAGLFTTNVLKAAPVILSRKRVQRGYARALLINSGNANACTGAEGIKDAEEMAARAAGRLGLKAEEVLLASTGIIGERLPMNKIDGGIEQLCHALSSDGGHDAAEAIMTTDTFRKSMSTCFEIDGRNVTIGAMAKGSGMVNPKMATLITVFTTDIAVEPETLKEALSTAVQPSLNALTIDGQMSTNDCVFVFANGAAGGDFVKRNSNGFDNFVAALTGLAVEITKSLAADGEGATKMIMVTVEGASSPEDADRAARAVANSLLVKTAIYGKDPNWGRIFSAIGACGIGFDPHDVFLAISGQTIACNGAPVSFDLQKLSHSLESRDITIRLKIGGGSHSATIYTCDLTHKYISINAEYHT
jgi:glutamate N-acetyltransferase/amino-acid N-acetyltransferase